MEKLYKTTPAFKKHMLQNLKLVKTHVFIMAIEKAHVDIVVLDLHCDCYIGTCGEEHYSWYTSKWKGQCQHYYIWRPNSVYSSQILFHTTYAWQISPWLNHWTNSWTLKISIHGIPYIVLFIVMQNILLWIPIIPCLFKCP